MSGNTIHDSSFPLAAIPLVAASLVAGCAPVDPGEPVLLEAPVPTSVHALWGDIHAHSNISGDAPDSIPPMDMYEAMRDEADLDFGAVTDHDLNLEDFTWRATKVAANTLNCEGPRDEASCPGGRHFVTLLGYEWTSHLHGHRHVLLYQDAGRPWRSKYVLDGDASIPMLASNAPVADEPCELWGGYDALMDGTVPNLDLISIAHHPAQADGTPPLMDWGQAPQLCDTPYPASYQPLVEVFSRHGNSEFEGMAFPEDDPVGCREAVDEGATVREALAMVGPDGAPLHMLGMVGSGDSHDGRPGLDGWGEDRLENCPSAPLDDAGQLVPGPSVRVEQTGLVCAYVRAPSRERALARKPVFSALRDRFTYATTGARIGLWFEVGITAEQGGTSWVHMGEETELDPMAGEGAIARLHVEQDDQPLSSIELLWLDPEDGEWQVCQQWSDPSSPASLHVDLVDTCAAPGWNSYYVKVTQQPDPAGSPLPAAAPGWVEREMAWSSPIWVRMD